MSFKIPDNFQEVNPADIQLSSDDEVYLLRVPKGYDVSKINGKEFIPNQITEIEVQKEKNDLMSVYELSSFAQQPQDISPIIKNKDGITLGPQVCGILNVSKSYRLPPSTFQSSVNPVKEKYVEMPEGLKARFVPFGSGKPCKMRKSKRKKRNRSSAESFADHSDTRQKKKRKVDGIADELCDSTTPKVGMKSKNSNKRSLILSDTPETLNNSHDKRNSLTNGKRKR